MICVALGRSRHKYMMAEHKHLVEQGAKLVELRLDYIDERCDLKGKRVLDVACGGGILSEAMAARGADVSGIDAGKQAVPP